MRILKKTLVVFFCFALSAMPLLAWSQTPESILDSIKAGRKPEKLFTHFDKAFYLPGETIWFKTYITIDGRPGILSTVAKAELISEKGAVIVSQIIPVTIGSASGSLSLPSDLAYGTYVFRLYTQQMLAMNSQDLYYKPIPVVSSAADFTKAVPATDISVRFFIEGGAFLADELNILAFSATDQLGKPVQASGTIKDSQGKEVVAFTTEYNGMGKVEITPKKGEQYTAQYSLPSGSSRSVLLPVIQNEGTNLLIIDEVLKKRLITNSKFSTDIQQKPAYILGEMDQTVIFKIDISKSNGHYMGRVPVQDLPGGLLHVAVFNAANKILAERTCFINSRKEVIDASLVPQSTGLAKRSENNFAFSLPDSLEGTFSLSVTDLAQTQWPLNNENIIAATLVTASLAPSASNPFYDLGQLTGLEKNDAVDLLLLTNEYKWNWEVLSQLANVKLPSISEDYIPLRGKAFADRNNRPALSGADLAFIVETKDSAVNSFTARTNEEGYFEVEGLFYEDTATVYVKNNTDKNRDKKVQLEIMSAPLAKKYNLSVQNNISSQVPAFLKMNEQVKNKPVQAPIPVIDVDTTVVVLEELVVTSKSKNPTRLLEEKYTKGLFSGAARATIDFVNDRPGFLGGNIFDYLKGRYSYMQVMGNYPDYTLVYRNMRSLGSGAPIPMNLYLDEMIVDANTLTTVPMKDIALVRIYTSGIMGTGGALAVYTKRGDGYTNNNVYENTNKFRLAGFSKIAPFYSPDYNNLKKLTIKNDNRKTLYWNPSLVFLPEDGKVPVSFFNNDSCKEYKIVLQGFTTDGKLVYMERRVQ